MLISGLPLVKSPAFNCAFAFLLWFSLRLSRSYLFVLGIDHERPGGGQELEQAQQDGARMEAAGYDQPAREKIDDEANVSRIK